MTINKFPRRGAAGYYRNEGMIITNSTKGGELNPDVATRILCKSRSVRVQCHAGLKAAVSFILALAMVSVALPFHYNASAAARPQAVRVGYVESESYSAFSRELAGIAYGLEKRGIISELETIPDETDAAAVWRTMAKSNGADRIVFIEKMFFSMKTMSEEDFTEFINSDEIDLLIVMGTTAGVYVSQHETKNDYMVFAASNPVLSGIVKSETERFKANSYAYIDPIRFRRQVHIAYKMFEFSRLGVVYEDSPAAYAYSGIDQVEAYAKTNGFSIVRRHVDEARNEADMPRYYDELKAAYAQLIDEGIDALYITTATTEPHMLPWLLEDVEANGILTISQVGEEQVENGVILGVTLDDPTDQGDFIARQFAHYLDGMAIDRLQQVYEIVPKIFLNYDAAIRSGIYLPFKTLLSMDTIFREGHEATGEKLK